MLSRQSGEVPDWSETEAAKDQASPHHVARGHIERCKERGRERQGRTQHFSGLGFWVYYDPMTTLKESRCDSPGGSLRDGVGSLVPIGISAITLRYIRVDGVDALLDRKRTCPGILP